MKVTIHLKEPENEWLSVSMSEDMLILFTKHMESGEGIINFWVNKSTISIPVKNVAYYLMENENE